MVESTLVPEAVVTKSIRPIVEVRQSTDNAPFIDVNHNGLRIVSKGAQGVGSLDFKSLAHSIGCESEMLHPSAEELEASWETGNTIVVLTENRIIGHSRIEDLPPKDQAEIDIAGSEEKIKKVIEVGSVFVVPEERHQRFASVMLEATLKLAIAKLEQQGIRQDQTAFIATTKGRDFRLAFISAGLRAGINFAPTIHTGFDEVSKRTCVCTMPFGRGRQLDDSCPSRISDEGLMKIKEDPAHPSDGSCVLLISNPNIDHPMVPVPSGINRVDAVRI